MRKIKHVVFFDLYQTLVDIDINEENKAKNEASGWEALARFLKKYGKDVAPAELLNIYEKRKEDFYSSDQDKHHDFLGIISSVLESSYGLRLSEDEMVELLYEYRKISRGHIRLYPKVLEVLGCLSQEYILAIASHAQRSVSQKEMEEIGIKKFFSHFFFTSDVGYRKSSPKFYKRCLEIVKRDPTDCIMIGDNYNQDVLVPQQIGMKAIWVKNPLTQGEYFVEREPRYSIVLGEFEKLPDLIIESCKNVD
jgi:putative hydrolase of the HAD superfamily